MKLNKQYHAYEFVVLYGVLRQDIVCVALKWVISYIVCICKLLMCVKRTVVFSVKVWRNGN